jgi:hypothetical protein
MEPIASCTTPMFSKMPATLKATQPEMLAICQAIGSALATIASGISPFDQSQMASAAVLTSITAFSEDSSSPFSVTSRVCRPKSRFSVSSASRTKASSCSARAKSFTVMMLV